MMFWRAVLAAGWAGAGWLNIVTACTLYTEHVTRHTYVTRDREHEADVDYPCRGGF